MNPLSARVFYSRHKRLTLILLALTIVITVGLYSMVALVWGIMVEPGILAYKAYSEFSLVTQRSPENDLSPSVINRLQSNSDIARISPTTFIRTKLPGLMPGQGFQFDLLGLLELDIPFLLARLDAKVKDGRLPSPGTAEMVISEDVAKILNVKVGDNYVVTSFEFYTGMDSPPEPTNFEVVGIVESNVELGIVSLEYLNNHSQYSQLPARFLVVAHEGREIMVEDFLRNEIMDINTSVITHQILNERILNEAIPGLVMLLPAVLIVAVALSLVIIVVNQLANAQRLPEFGILHATGYSKRWLILRLTLETTTLAFAGWVIGVGLAYLGMNLLKVTYFAARGHDLNYILWLPIVFSLFIPFSIGWISYIAVRRSLSHLDAVAIVERRELSQEGEQKRPRSVSDSLIKPLAATTFYQRHRRRSILLVSSMAMMILAIALFIFALAVDADAKKPFLAYMKQISIVRSPGFVESLNPDIERRIKAHPSVERVIPIAPRFSMLNINIPPFDSAEASPFALHAEDMAYLVKLFNLELNEGHLPQPGTNEMVISNALAKNRDLYVGDVVGDPQNPAYPGAPSLENKFVISGIFAQPEDATDAYGVSFISFEYLESLDIYEIPEHPPLIVVPKQGQKNVLDDWLESELAGVEASVLTYDQEINRINNKAKQDISSIVILQGILTVVAGIGLAVLNNVFTSQRYSEFGVLNALGYSRQQLLRRVVGETAFTTWIAWGLSVIISIIGIFLLRFAVFAPLGLTFDLINLTPWLYTLPIPVAVMVFTSISTARNLSKLDPITIIERR